MGTDIHSNSVQARPVGVTTRAVLGSWFIFLPSLREFHIASEFSCLRMSLFLVCTRRVLSTNIYGLMRVSNDCLRVSTHV